ARLHPNPFSSKLRTSPAIQPSEISELQTNINELQKSFDIYVKPRTITEAQSKMIIDYLLPRSHHTIAIYFVHPNEESQQLAGQIYNVLRLSEWDVTMNAAPDGKIPNGPVINPGLR